MYPQLKFLCWNIRGLNRLSKRHVEMDIACKFKVVSEDIFATGTLHRGGSFMWIINEATRQSG